MTVGNVNSGVTTYTLLVGVGGINAAEANRRIPEATSGTLLRLVVRAATFTLNVNAVLTIMINGVATSLTVTVLAATTDYEVEVAVPYAKGDWLAMRIDTTASGAGSIQDFGWDIARVTNP